VTVFELRLFVSTNVEMAEDKRSYDPALARFYYSMKRTNVEKIIDEILPRLSEDSGDSEGFDIESDNDDAKDRPWRPSHVVFGKSTVTPLVLQELKIWHNIICINISLCMLHLECIH
jgi:hypothetical protein